jgi:hypothetical protein
MSAKATWTPNLTSMCYPANTHTHKQSSLARLLINYHFSIFNLLSVITFFFHHFTHSFHKIVFQRNQFLGFRASIKPKKKNPIPILVLFVSIFSSFHCVVLISVLRAVEITQQPSRAAILRMLYEALFADPNLSQDQIVSARNPLVLF